MFKSGKKIRALRNKKINILTLVFSEKIILNETKNHNPPPPPPPFQVKWSVPNDCLVSTSAEPTVENVNNLILA